MGPARNTDTLRSRDVHPDGTLGPATSRANARSSTLARNGQLQASMSVCYLATFALGASVREAWPRCAPAGSRAAQRGDSRWRRDKRPLLALHAPRPHAAHAITMSQHGIRGTLPSPHFARSPRNVRVSADQSSPVDVIVTAYLPQLSRPCRESSSLRRQPRGRCGACRLQTQGPRVQRMLKMGVLLRAHRPAAGETV